ncbi:hypothetical protein HK098_001233 [Nowakowskiella sp. JEL0407]|nr:hypothetical protein HK098_001233 [Nowakowskiella sp. JEL0407]
MVRELQLPLQQGIFSTFTNEIQTGILTSTNPGSIIHTAIAIECQPGGLIHDTINNSIELACEAPNGAIHKAIARYVKIMEQRVEIRRLNEYCRALDDKLVPLPDFNGEYPRMFPKAVGMFNEMEAGEVEELIKFYEIEVEVGMDNFLALKEFCGVH